MKFSLTFDSKKFKEKRVYTLIYFDQAPHLAVFDDYLYLASKDLEIRNISNPERPRLVTRMHLQHPIKKILVSERHSLLITLEENESLIIRIFDVSDPEKPEMIRELHTSPEAYVRISNYILAIGDKSHIEMYELEELKRKDIEPYRFSIPLKHFDFDIGDEYYVTVYRSSLFDGKISFEVRSLKEPLLIAVVPRPISGLVLEGNKLFTYSKYKLAARKIEGVKVEKLREYDHDEPITSIAISELVAVGGAKGKIAILKEGKKLREIKEYAEESEGIRELAFKDNLLIVQADSKIGLYYLPNLPKSLSWRVYEPYRVDISDGFLAYSSRDKVVLRDIKNPRKPKLLKILKGKNRIGDVALGNTKPLLAFVEYNGRVSIYDISNPSKPKRLLGERPTSHAILLRFAPDDRRLVVVYKYAIVIYDLSEPRASRKIMDEKDLPYLYSYLASDSAPMIVEVEICSGEDSEEVRIFLSTGEVYVIKEDEITILRDKKKLKKRCSKNTSLSYKLFGPRLVLYEDNKPISVVYERPDYVEYDINEIDGSVIQAVYVKEEAEPIRKEFKLELSNAKTHPKPLEAREKAVKLAKNFEREPVKSLKKAAEIGVLDKLVEILEDSGLVRKNGDVYEVIPTAEEIVE